MADTHCTPIAQRPPIAKQQYIYAALFSVLFNLGCLFVNFTQFLIWPVRLVNGELYEEGISWTKGAFGALLVLVTQWFAPTTFVVTYEGDTPEDEVFERDAQGNVLRIRLPPKLVIMANHQMYTDWLYLWCFTYFANTHDQVLIILKKSLKHIPIVGWGMQFYRFLFLARSWSSDRIYLGQHLTSIAKRAQVAGDALSLMIFPEGTLVSKDTRPLSAKFAAKTGISDLDHTLLPRSTGLLFLLRTLTPSIPSLHLLDVTIGYPGIPAGGYAQDYYTLRSTFMAGVPPPKIHLHIRLYRASDIPIGDVSARDGVGRGAEATTEEAARFEGWLRERWTEKDRLMDGFYRDGRFDVKAKGVRAVEIPVKLRSKWDIGQAFSWFAPAVAYSVARTVLRWIKAVVA